MVQKIDIYHINVLYFKIFSFLISIIVENPHFWMTPTKRPRPIFSDVTSVSQMSTSQMSQVKPKN